MAESGGGGGMTLPVLFHGRARGASTDKKKTHSPDGYVLVSTYWILPQLPSPLDLPKKKEINNGTTVAP